MHPDQLCRWRNEYRSQKLETNPAKYQDISFFPVTVTALSLDNQKMMIDEQDPYRHSIHHRGIDEQHTHMHGNAPASAVLNSHVEKRQ